MEMSVAQVLEGNRWIASIEGTLSVPAIVQSVEMWLTVQDTPILREEADKSRWLLTANGQYSVKFAYQACFLGSVSVDYAELL